MGGNCLCIRHVLVHLRACECERVGHRLLEIEMPINDVHTIIVTMCRTSEQAPNPHSQHKPTKPALYVVCCHTWTGDHARYLRLALLLRRHQGATSVMAINGGKTAAATAAVENLMWKEERVKWTVFGGKRVDHKSGQCCVEEKNSTLVELCEDLKAKGAVPASMAFVHLNGCAEGM